MSENNTESAPATSATAEKQPSKLILFMERYFSNIFSKQHWIYTILFAGIAVFLAITSLFPSTIILDIDLVITVAMMGGFLLLFVFCNRKPLKQYILEGNVGIRAAMLGIFAAIFVGIAIVWYFLTNDLTGGAAKYQFTNLLPVVFMICLPGLELRGRSYSSGKHWKTSLMRFR